MPVPSQSTGALQADRQAERLIDRQRGRLCGEPVVKVPRRRGGVSPIEFARLSSARDGVLTSSY